MYDSTNATITITYSKWCFFPWVYISIEAIRLKVKTLNFSVSEKWRVSGIICNVEEEPNGRNSVKFGSSLFSTKVRMRQNWHLPVHKTNAIWKGSWDIVARNWRRIVCLILPNYILLLKLVNKAQECRDLCKCIEEERAPFFFFKKKGGGCWVIRNQRSRELLDFQVK